METIKFDQDITVMYVDAISFPDGALAAHQKLHSYFPFTTQRKYFGLSRPENGSILYKAAAEVMEPGEAEKYKLPTIVLKKGNYYSITLYDYIKDIPSIQRTFSQLISLPDIDPEGYCVEQYIGQSDMLCMVRIAD